MFEELTAIERWARSQVTRIEALRAALKTIGREAYEGYLAPQIAQPFYYFEDKENEKGMPSVLKTRTYLQRSDFRELREKLGTMGFRYVGNGSFEGKDRAGIAAITSEYGLLSVNNGILQTSAHAP